ncbi:hypothetical protein BH23CHL5_BH23CHL5_12070 [soil metagenome]
MKPGQPIWNSADHSVTRQHLLRHASMPPVIAFGRIAIQRASGQTDSRSSGSPEASPAASLQASPLPVTNIYMTQQLRFDPIELEVNVGDTIQWVNASTMPHTATGDPQQNPVQATNPEYVLLPEGAEQWSSSILQPGETYEHTFVVAGRYEYLCIPHVLSGMRGSIEVHE